MTQILHLPRRFTTGWIGLAHALVAAPARRRPPFALTEPAIFRSECFAEDLEAQGASRRAAPASGARAR